MHLDRCISVLTAPNIQTGFDCQWRHSTVWGWNIIEQTEEVENTSLWIQQETHCVVSLWEDRSIQTKGQLQKLLLL